MDRSALLDRVQSTPEWDIVIIGGGATGLGAAVDAASRGYRTLLLEAYDFAKGTSSRSTKLVHGGVRYLAQGNISLVREALHERGLLHRNAPHLTRSTAFVIPVYSWLASGWYGIGLKVYDLLSGKLSIGHSRIISYGETIQRVPTVEREGLIGGVVYHDGQFDDTRLAMTLMRTVIDNEGVALNYARVNGVVKNSSGKVSGVRFKDTESGEEYEVRAKAVVNATGVFADAVRQMDDTGAKTMLSPSQGVHLIIDRKFCPTDNAIMVPKTADGRVLFIVPWHDRAIVGTTDTPVKETSYEPRPLEAELEFLMEHAAKYLSIDPQPSDIRSVYVGLRPLVKHDGTGSTAALSRDHTLIVSDSGLITITGGKWTTYRRMGQDTINRAIKVGSLPERPCITETLHLHGYDEQPASAPMDVYGTDAAAVEALCQSAPGLDDLLHERLPYRAGEVVWAARNEMARTVEDIMSRRTRALLLDARASQDAAPRVAALLAAELGHDELWQSAQVQTYRELAEGYVFEAALERAA